MALEVIAIGSDNIVRLDLLTDASGAGGTLIGGATVSFTLKDATGAAILSNVSMPMSVLLARYEGTIPATTTNTLTLNALYTIEITATYSGTTLFRKLSCIAKYRSNQ
jgi:hypothetical protein